MTEHAEVRAGVVSDPAFDLELGLAYLWDDAKARNGGFRIYAHRPEVLRDDNGFITQADGQRIMHRGQPVKDWQHPQADRVVVLSRDDRRRLAYGSKRPANKGVANRERDTTDRMLVAMEKAGRVVIERNATCQRTGKRGWRILEVFTDGQ